jgi:hypothetical protein
VSTPCGGIAFYGPFLRQLGFCNVTSDALTVTAAALYRPWGAAGRTTPPAIAGTVEFRRVASAVEAVLTGTDLVAAEHAMGLLLVDAATGAPVLLDYGVDTSVTADASGRVATVRLATADKQLPAAMRAYLLVGVGAVATAVIAGP